MSHNLDKIRKRKHLIKDNTDSGFSSSPSTSSTPTTSNSLPKTKNNTQLCFAINKQKRLISIISMEKLENNDNFIFLESINVEMSQKIGRKLDESEVDEKNDNYIHCGECECFYSYCCFEHPFYRALDRVVRPGKMLNLSRALQTLPNYLNVQISSIPNAGRGVFTKVKFYKIIKKSYYLKEKTNKV